MAQAGLHALAGVITRRSALKRSWLFLGILLGNMLPDLDNYAVAVGTVAGWDTHNLHRTFTHSVFTILLILIIFFVTGMVRKDDRWKNLGYGLGIGVAMHMALDLIIWFNGVPLFWPLGAELNFWKNVTPPAQLKTFLDYSAELLFFGLYLYWLFRLSKNQNTDLQHQKNLRVWMLALFILGIVFLPLSYMNVPGILIIFGPFYLIGITAAFVWTVKMRATVEAA